MTQNNKKGFTLIELLVVIAIIGILSAIGLVTLTGTRGKARDAKRISDLRQYSLAYQSRFDDQATYDTACARATAASACANLNTYFGGSASAPEERGATTTCTLSTAPADCCGETARQYTIAVDDSTTAFEVATRLESGTGGFPAGPVNVSPAGIAACT